MTSRHHPTPPPEHFRHFVQGISLNEEQQRAVEEYCAAHPERVIYPMEAWWRFTRRKGRLTASLFVGFKIG